MKCALERAKGEMDGVVGGRTVRHMDSTKQSSTSKRRHQCTTRCVPPRQRYSNGENFSSQFNASMCSVSKTFLCLSLLTRITHSRLCGLILNPSVYAKVS